MKKNYFYGFILLLFVFLLFHRPIQANAGQEDKVVTAQAGDTSAALQKLLDYNKNGGYNLTINIPAGTYILYTELLIYSNTTIIADSEAKLMKNHQKGAMISNDLSKDKGGYTTTENITISGGIWDSSKISDKGTESFRFIHATNVTIKDATICNVPENSHLITLAGIKDALINNCTLYGYDGSNAKEAIQLDIVHDNVIVPSMQAEFIQYDDLACDGITITNCEIYNYPRAIGSHTSIKGVFHKNIVISENNLHDIKEVAIKAYNYVNVVISNNTITNAGTGVFAYSHFSNAKSHYLEALKTTRKEPLPTNYNIVIKNNTIHNTLQIKTASSAAWGDAIRAVGCKSRPLSGVTIKDNTITATERYGIFLERTPSSTIANNNISSTSSNGIYLLRTCNYTEITGNTLSEPGDMDNGTGSGIAISVSTDVTIADNSITSPAKDGIFIEEKSTSCTIANNTVLAAGDNAVALYSQSNETTVTNNTLTDYTSRGIYTYKINSAIITDNKINGQSGKSEEGIHIAGNNNQNNAFSLTGNYIKTSECYGIYIISAPKCYLFNNTIIDAVKNGIFLDEGSDGTMIYYNSITNAGKIGNVNDSIDISKSKKALLFQNTISWL